MRSWSEFTSRLVVDQKIAKETKSMWNDPFATFVSGCSNPTVQTGKWFWTNSFGLART